MHGLGTLMNMGGIIIGGLIGLLFGKNIKEKMQETVIIVLGLSTIVMSLGGILEEMITITDGKLEAQGTIMMIASLVIGAVIGEALNLEGLVERLGTWLKKKSGSEDDASFVSSFVEASCIVCIGAMAIVGAIEDGISGDYSILLIKGLLDAAIICILAASRGKGAVFSAVPVGLWQGFVTLIAFFAGNFLTDAALSNLSYVGNILIVCVGLNLVFKNMNIRVANLLPAIFIAAAWGFLF